MHDTLQTAPCWQHTHQLPGIDGLAADMIRQGGYAETVDCGVSNTRHMVLAWLFSRSA
ncbi:hypothetical protein [Novosphingobium sp. B-7]|uniref:hypothetical protein n=1 Tax=Novosphingobium sp. B-7 TaxID=1298855 RepID=UPI00041F527F